jgi:uncharacterized Fe-S cluster-containing protein
LDYVLKEQVTTIHAMCMIDHTLSSEVSTQIGCRSRGEGNQVKIFTGDHHG